MNFLKNVVDLIDKFQSFLSENMWAKILFLTTPFNLFFLAFLGKTFHDNKVVKWVGVVSFHILIFGITLIMSFFTIFPIFIYFYIWFKIFKSKETARRLVKEGIYSKAEIIKKEKVFGRKVASGGNFKIYIAIPLSLTVIFLFTYFKTENYLIFFISLYVWFIILTILFLSSKKDKTSLYDFTLKHKGKEYMIQVRGMLNSRKTGDVVDVKYLKDDESVLMLEDSSGRYFLNEIKPFKNKV